jgi:uncharacterized membrane protein
MGNKEVEIMLLGLLIVFIVFLNSNRWERNMGGRREGEKGRKIMKERKKGGKGQRYRRSHSLLI